MSRWVTAAVRQGVVLLLAAAGLAVLAPSASAAPPGGFLDFIESPEPGIVWARGWVVDPDAPGARVRIHLYIGGAAGDPAAEGMDAGGTGVPRPDVDAAYPGLGYGSSGFDFTVPTSRRGRQPVYAYAIDAAGENSYLGVREVDLGHPDPTGGLRTLESEPHRRVTVGGYAWDMSPPRAPVEVEVWVGGPAGDPAAEGPFRGRADQPYDVLGNVGYRFSFQLGRLTGDQPVFVYAINQGPGFDQLIGRDSVNVKVDRTPPNAPRIVGLPPTPVGPGRVEVGFAGDEPGLRFQCNWDSVGWEDCRSPAARSLGAGAHRFEVRAIDAAGNVGAGTQARIEVQAGAVAPPPLDPETGLPVVEGTTLSVSATAVSKKSRLRVRVRPGSAEVDFRFVVQEKVGRKWRKVRRSATRKAAEQRVLDLPKGRYRVVVPAQHGYAGARGKPVRLRR